MDLPLPGASTIHAGREARTMTRPIDFGDLGPDQRREVARELLRRMPPIPPDPHEGAKRQAVLRILASLPTPPTVEELTRLCTEAGIWNEQDDERARALALRRRLFEMADEEPRRRRPKPKRPR